MSLNPRTVHGHLARAKAKLGLTRRRDIVRFALEAGLLRAESERWPGRLDVRRHGRSNGRGLPSVE